MFKTKKIERNIYSVSIDLPRVETDETDFSNFLNNIITKKSFAIIFSVDGEKSFSLDSKKELGIWFRNNKETLSNNCSGFARVLSVNSNSEKLDSKAMKTAFPCPYKVVSSEQEALTWLTGLLSN